MTIYIIKDNEGHIHNTTLEYGDVERLKKEAQTKLEFQGSTLRVGMTEMKIEGDKKIKDLLSAFDGALSYFIYEQIPEQKSIEYWRKIINNAKLLI